MVCLRFGIFIFMNIKISYRAVPNCLRKYRRIRRLKQKQVALILGLKTTSRILQWENGSTIPNIVNLFKLAIIYRVLPDALFIDLVRDLREEIRKGEEKVLGNVSERNG